MASYYWSGAGGVVFEPHVRRCCVGQAGVDFSNTCERTDDGFQRVGSADVHVWETDLQNSVCVEAVFGDVRDACDLRFFALGDGSSGRERAGFGDGA